MGLNMEENKHEPLRIYHETSPWIAIHIARTQQFMGGAISGDAGLNCYIEGSLPDLNIFSQAEQKGALMTFEWSGPVSTEPYGVFGEPDTLYDQRPHRGFIPVDSTKHLKLVGIELLRGGMFSDLIERPPVPRGFSLFKLSAWAEWLASKQEGWLDAESKRLELQVSMLAASRPSISVVPPVRAPYLHLLEEWRAERAARGVDASPERECANS